ncbi:hypothetical protein [Alicyclobacillus vulcanalis]|uniref:Uncharacterized protein n=1 Tax=Alicyclobacillus vulcanalis TaxID=252246 RepID=A0A1N7MP74_9BACL|nr:hypothetical protein [Alicyclobacillus vulcanalis]SIS87956.1 hypothetical protein SAMN05421799_1067 [Alicyclobacillus vulcanalis]
MDLKLTTIRITAVKQVGELSGARVRALQPMEQEGFQLVNQAPVAILFVNPVERKHIVVTNNEITAMLQGDNLDVQYDFFSEYLSKIFDLLQLDSKAQFNFEIGAQGNVFRDTMTGSIEHFVHGVDLHPWIKGIGYRFIIQHGDLKGDLRIEPLIADPTRAFVSLVMGSDAMVTMDEFTHTIKNASENLISFADNYTQILLGQK